MSHCGRGVLHPPPTAMTLNVVWMSGRITSASTAMTLNVLWMSGRITSAPDRNDSESTVDVGRITSAPTAMTLNVLWMSGRIASAPTSTVHIYQYKFCNRFYLSSSTTIFTLFPAGAEKEKEVLGSIYKD